jgi:hypothetical protein
LSHFLPQHWHVLVPDRMDPGTNSEWERGRPLFNPAK